MKRGPCNGPAVPSREYFNLPHNGFRFTATLTRTKQLMRVNGWKVVQEECIYVQCRKSADVQMSLRKEWTDGMT